MSHKVQNTLRKILLGDSASEVRRYLKLDRGGRYFTSEMVLLALAVFSGIMLLWILLSDYDNMPVQVTFGVIMTFSLVIFIRLLLDPDSLAARQTAEILSLAGTMLTFAKDGLTSEASQKICELLRPATSAIAVAITDREHILGYAGYNEDRNPAGSDIRTHATKLTLEDGKARVLTTHDEIGLPDTEGRSRIQAAIIMPLVVGSRIEGTLKFYYRKASHISQTQESTAKGFAELLSTQMSAAAFEEQQRLATSMELKALQAQINPHFLFNTLNTIASFIRTDPMKARTLLRDFSVFYRSTLEDAHDLIPLQREIDQVKRYFSFEVARFGEERLKLVVDVEPEVSQLLVPSFMVQPLVENSVKHAMKSEGQLTIHVRAAIDDSGSVAISVQDNGVGMTEEARQGILHPKSSSGLGIAVKNVRDRMRGYFGPDAAMEVESELGKGTTITFRFSRPPSGIYLDTAGGTIDLSAQGFDRPKTFPTDAANDEGASHDDACDDDDGEDEE